MLFHNHLGRISAAVTLFVLATTAQQCYYPDGTPSSDTPCSTGSASSCCGASSFCLENGLCFGNGVISRGSCTDESWHSQACTPYCKSAMPDTSVPLAPCSVSGNSSVFVCGLQTSCSSNTAFIMQGAGTFVLRAAQVAALAGPALASAAANNTTPTGGPYYTLDALVGVGAGLGIPLLFAVCALIFLARRQARPRIARTVLYDLPDAYKSDLALSPPPPPHHAGSRPGSADKLGPLPSPNQLHRSPQPSPLYSSTFSNSHYSDASSGYTQSSGLPTPPPMINMTGYVDRYAAYKDPGAGGGPGGLPGRAASPGFGPGGRAASPGFGPGLSPSPSPGYAHPHPHTHGRGFGPAVELDSTERPVVRVELAARTKSNKSTRSGRSARSRKSVMWRSRPELPNPQGSPSLPPDR